MTTPSTAPGSIPTVPVLPSLPIPPYGADVFTDFNRQKSFTVLYFRHGGGDRARVLTWIGDVLDGLAAAGIPAPGPCEITLTPDPARSKVRGKFLCHLKVPVEWKG